MRSKKNSAPIVLKVNNELKSNPHDIANMFALKFSQVNLIAHTSNSASLSYPFQSNPILNTFYLFPTTSDEIITTVKNLKNSFSSGPDDIPSSVLKQIIPCISEPLEVLINECFNTGTFPDVYKMAKVILLFKKGEKTNIDNFRGISLLSSTSKIIESLIYQRLNDFLSKNDIISESQFGFRKSVSCDSALFKITNKIQNSIDKKLHTVGLFIDIRKAFPSVNHEILLQKLYHYGFRGVALDLFKTYLKSRPQYVHIKSEVTETQSDTYYLDNSVPEGSILGPPFFSVYINDLPDFLPPNVDVTLYADDTNILITAPTLQELEDTFQNVSSSLARWMKLNKLSLSIEKSNVVIFSKFTSPSFNPILDNTPVPITKATKILGVMLDSDGTWFPHFDYLSKKLSTALYTLRVLKSCVDQQVLITSYYAYFYSLMKYGIILWGASSQAQSIFILQKKAIRIILNLNSHKKYNASCRSRFRELGLLTLPSLYILQITLFLKSNPAYIQHNTDIHSHNTRQKNHAHLPPCHTSRLLKGCLSKGCEIYNKLPEDIRSEGSTNKLKRKLRDYLVEKEFYSLNDFLNNS